MTCCSSSADLTVFYGDTAPQFAVDFPYDISGSEIRLNLNFGSYYTTRSSSNPSDGITVSGSRVTITPTAFNPPEWSIKAGRYSLQRVWAPGQIRTYLTGNITTGKAP